MLASHDARLIEATECDLWVCGDSETNLRVEPAGAFACLCPLSLFYSWI